MPKREASFDETKKRRTPRPLKRPRRILSTENENLGEDQLEQDNQQRRGPDQVDELLERPVTHETLHAFQRQQGFDLPLKNFVALCAYLISLLRLGFRFHVNDLDGFFTSAQTYALLYKGWEEEQMTVEKPSFPSYHLWYREQLLSLHRGTQIEFWARSCIDDTIMTEDKLRRIWRENQYIFLRTKLTLQTMAQRWTNVDFDQ